MKFLIIIFFSTCISQAQSFSDELSKLNIKDSLYNFNDFKKVSRKNINKKINIFSNLKLESYQNLPFDTYLLKISSNDKFNFYLIFTKSIFGLSKGLGASYSDLLIYDKIEKNFILIEYEYGVIPFLMFDKGILRVYNTNFGFGITKILFLDKSLNPSKEIICQQFLEQFVSKSIVYNYQQKKWKISEFTFENKNIKIEELSRFNILKLIDENSKKFSKIANKENSSTIFKFN